MSGRTILVGDVHGCRDELAMMLEQVAFCASDRLVLVGDLVVRGPDPAGVLDLCMAMKGEAVLGNHEDRLLRIRRHETRINDYQRSTLAAMRDEHWAYLESLPVWRDLPDHGVRVVHAGVVPGVPIEKQDRRAMLSMRCLDASGTPLERNGEDLWGLRYGEDREHDRLHVVFGHNSRPQPQLHRCATGLDTGCVYGGRLTALVLAEGQRPPSVEERAEALVFVKARKAYTEH